MPLWRCVHSQFMLSKAEFSDKRKYLSLSERIVFVIDEHHDILTAWDQMKPSRLDAVNDCKSAGFYQHSLTPSPSVSNENHNWKEIKYLNL
jgi:hypothetical protein